MKRLILSLTFLAAFASAASAECYADYKAKQDDPLRLQYGVAQIDGPCTVGDANEELVSRLADEGWQLLEVLDVFDLAGAELRRENAGDYYLRY
ncbi:hypothetical protein OG2516_09605 [Oceanicola granulosus HTCC2516]|uniref:DUF4177 domain-containing protein n=1 Tax=Oceanicola granulosus (strain ATCC BAA-861 / DSM 15982 / KCTC 12143 / HTCC2516) TaxID=314256 RepID=Q2CCY3_OCEGH|nr:hypothetical protein [Oceanicola granulosus]EAR50490.1 hypothetical protein OG2516_09605 [Oceanicola granulosus HTCC2516]